jgi:hypothetical protein
MTECRALALGVRLFYSIRHQRATEALAEAQVLTKAEPAFKIQQIKFFFIIM